MKGQWKGEEGERLWEGRPWPSCLRVGKVRERGRTRGWVWPHSGGLREQRWCDGEEEEEDGPQE